MAIPVLASWTLARNFRSSQPGQVKLAPEQNARKDTMSMEVTLWLKPSPGRLHSGRNVSHYQGMQHTKGHICLNTPSDWKKLSPMAIVCHVDIRVSFLSCRHQCLLLRFRILNSRVPSLNQSSVNTMIYLFQLRLSTYYIKRKKKWTLEDKNLVLIDGLPALAFGLCALKKGKLLIHTVDKSVQTLRQLQLAEQSCSQYIFTELKFIRNALVITFL